MDNKYNLGYLTIKELNGKLDAGFTALKRVALDRNEYERCDPYSDRWIDLAYEQDKITRLIKELQNEIDKRKYGVDGNMIDDIDEYSAQ